MEYAKRKNARGMAGAFNQVTWRVIGVNYSDYVLPAD